MIEQGGSTQFFEMRVARYAARPTQGGRTMRQIISGLFAVAVLFPMQVFADPPESECIPYLAGQYRQAQSNATQCGASASLMATFPWANESRYRCSGGRPQQASSNQLTAFQQCAITYACAGQFYACAIQKKNSGMGCRAAMAGCQ